MFNPDGPDGDMDESGPIFWETVHLFARRGQHLSLPRELVLPEPSIGVQVLELQRRVTIGTDTQLLPVIEGELAE